MTLSARLKKLPRSRELTALCVFMALLVSCSSNPSNDVAVSPAIESTSARINQLLSSTESFTEADRAAAIMQLAQEFLSQSEISETNQLLGEISRANRLPPELQLEYALLEAGLALQQGNQAAAQRWLEGELTSAADAKTALGARYFYTLGRLYEDNDDLENAVTAYAEATAFYADDATNDIYDRIWLALQNLTDPMLEILATVANSYDLRGWIELERVYRDDEFSMSSQLDAIARWQTIWASHPATRRLPTTLAELRSIWEQRPRHIVLMLPLSQPAGIAIQEGFLSAYYQSLAENRNQPQVTVLDSSEVDNIFDLYQQAIELEADLVIGPLSKFLVNQLQNVDRLPITTLALNYLDSPGQLPNNLYQFGLDPEDEIRQAALIAWQQGHRSAAIVTPDTQDYMRLQNSFYTIWEELGGTVVSAASYTETNDYSDVVKRLMAIDYSEARADRILDLLPRNSMEFTPRRRQDIDYIFLIANPRQGRLIKPTLAFYFAEDVPVYALPSIYEGQVNENEDRDLNGIWFTDAPWLLSADDELKTAVDNNLRITGGPFQRLRALGIDSFRLYARLGMLASGQLESLSGTTGRLSIVGNSRIHRDLQVARFINGRAEIQTDTVNSSDD